MSLSKSSRDYVKEYGRTALRKKEGQTIDLGECGFIYVFWHPLDFDFVWRGQVTYRGSIYSSDCSCMTEAVQWVQAKYKYLTSTVTLGMWLESMMDAHNVTSTDLASSMGISRMTLHQWIKDKRKPTVDNWIQLAQIWATHSDEPVESMMGQMSKLQK